MDYRSSTFLELAGLPLVSSVFRTGARILRNLCSYLAHDSGTSACVLRAYATPKDLILMVWPTKVSRFCSYDPLANSSGNGSDDGDIPDTFPMAVSFKAVFREGCSPGRHNSSRVSGNGCLLHKIRNDFCCAHTFGGIQPNQLGKRGVHHCENILVTFFRRS